MATHYLYGTVLTGEAVAANNRGENIGNMTTLQKVFHQDDLHTTVSAEAIRFALRYRFQLQALPVNRKYDGALGKLTYVDEKRQGWDPSKDVFVDDDIMGFMDAAAAAKEREEEDAEGGDSVGQPAVEEKAGARTKKSKGTITKRPSPLAIGRAVSLRPYRGELSFNCVSGAKEKGSLSLYSAEMHTTEYQYSFGINLGDVIAKANIGHVLDGIIDPPPVAGNHARFAFDFSPASIVMRLTNAHASRIQNCFEHDSGNRSFTVGRLIERVRSGDLPAHELFIGGEVAATPEGQLLEKLNVRCHSGVLAAAGAVRKEIAAIGSQYKSLADPPAVGAHI